MKKMILSFMALACTCGVSAQQYIYGSRPIISPEVHEDRTVTFRFPAFFARHVYITGDFIPDNPDSLSCVDMTRPFEYGIWEYTTEPLESELYSYRIFVDGVPTIDPGNMYLIRDIDQMANIFIVGSGRGDLYSVQDVPHGTVANRWYTSPTLGKERRMTVYTLQKKDWQNFQMSILYFRHLKQQICLKNMITFF